MTAPKLTAKAEELLRRVELKNQLRPKRDPNAGVTPVLEDSPTPQPGSGTLLSPGELAALLGK